jgi:Icc-related predicted phosphoesterase
MELDGIKIDLLSDTHSQHDKITTKGGDFLLHAGDMSYQGTIKEIWPFLQWFAAQNYKHKVLVPGNHDWGFEQAFGVFNDACKQLGIHLLNDTSITLDGIKIHGSPIQPAFCDWAFNRERGEDIKKHWDLIPEDTEILVTHGPPEGILDETTRGERVGCKDLWNRIVQTQVKLHVFGHIHEGRGHKYFEDKMFVNASAVNARYKIVSGEPIRVVKGLDGVYLPE